MASVPLNTVPYPVPPDRTSKCPPATMLALLDTPITCSSPLLTVEPSSLAPEDTYSSPPRRMLRYDAPLTVTTGVIPQGQSEASLRAFAAAVAAFDDFGLTALHVATGACGSLVIALALLEGRIDPNEAFAASQLDETFQIEAWGEDLEQAARRRKLAVEIAATARFVSLVRCAS